MEISGDETSQGFCSQTCDDLSRMTRPVGKGLAGVEGSLPGYLVSLWSPKDSKRSSLMLRLGPLRPEATCPRRLALLQQVWGRVRRHGLVTTWPLPVARACPGGPGRTIGDGTSSLHPEGGLPHLRGPGGGQRGKSSFPGFGVGGSWGRGYCPAPKELPLGRPLPGDHAHPRLLRAENRSWRPPGRAGRHRPPP